MAFKDGINKVTKKVRAKAEEKLKDAANNVQEKPKMGYINGYQEEKSLIDQAIASTIKGNTKEFISQNFDRDSDGNKIVGDVHANTNSIMPSDDMQTFRTTVRNLNDTNTDFFYEDPTFLGFDIMFDTSASPLFNYGVDINTPQKNSAAAFINQYNNIEEIAKRGDILLEFQNNIFKIFDFEFKNKAAEKNKTYYIEQILGLDKLNNKMVKDDDVISIKLVEDVSMRVLYLAELYNNLVYSYRNQRYLIPINCLRFDIKIKISDVRFFKTPNPDYDSKKPVSSTNPLEILSTPSMVIYTLHDCNFDFTNSQIFDAGITSGGFNALDMSPRNMTFNIKYKSVTRELITPLISNSRYLNNKKENPTLAVAQNSSGMFSNYKSATKLKEENQHKTFQKKIADKLITIGKDNVNDEVKVLTDKFRDARGKLIDNMFSELRSSVNVPKIYPDNVYSEDFAYGKVTPQKFLKGLGSDVFNAGEVATKKELGGALGSFGL